MFTDSGQAPGDLGASPLAMGDVAGDGDLDLPTSNGFPPTRVWLNDSTGRVTDLGRLLPTLVKSLALGDIYGNGDLDSGSRGFSPVNFV